MASTGSTRTKPLAHWSRHTVPFAWGPDASAAVEMAAAIELIAELAAHTLAIGPDRPPIEDELLDRHFSRKHGPMAYYGQP